jgi:cell division protein FtsL
LSEEPKQPAEQKKRTKGTSLSVSRFIILFGGIVAILLLIVNNSVTVDALVSDIGTLNSTYTRLRFENDSLQAQLKRLSSAERITRIASEKLGLVFSSQTLDQIQIDRDKLEKAEERDARDSTK